MRLTKPMKMMLMYVSMGPYICNAYELETALALERRGLAAVVRRTVALTEAGKETAKRLMAEWKGGVGV